MALMARVPVAELAQAEETIRALRTILQAWEPRVRCPQCGQRYTDFSCGPSHAIIRVQVEGGA